MPVREDHVRAVPAAIAMMVQAVRLTMDPVAIVTRARVVPPMMDQLALRIQDRVGRATAVLVAPVILVLAGRGRTARRFAGEAAWSVRFLPRTSI